MSPAPVHATAVARYGPGGWRAALLRGPSGAGKSDLALRLIGDGWRLVGDDYVAVWASSGGLFARGVEAIADCIEVRGLGIVALPCLPLSTVVLVADIVRHDVERMPERAEVVVCGVRLPRIILDARPPSAPRTLALAMSRL